MSTKFTDFARNEIYAFHRLTAILSTFLIASSIAILTLKGDCIGPVDKYFFIGVLFFGFGTIFTIWWRLRRTIFKYYGRLDNPEYPNANFLTKHLVTLPVHQSLDKDCLERIIRHIM